MYHHTDKSKFTREDCENSVGKKASFTFTGEIIDAGESTAGPWVRFKIDERFGFSPSILRMDMDLLHFKDESDS